MSLMALKARARASARNAGLSLAGAIFLAIGGAFFTAAAWIGIAEAHGTLVAALVIGGVYAGIGCILFALASRRHPPEPLADPAYAAAQEGRPPTQHGAVGPALVEALFVGISAGMAKRDRRT